MFYRYPIHELIENRCSELGISRSQLALRCSFKNISKGLRRIDSVCAGDLYSQTSKNVLDALPDVLGLEKTAVEAALHDTANIIAEAERKAAAEREAAWRGSFLPHGYLLGTHERPSQITIYGVTGGPGRWRKIRLDLSQPPVTFAGQAHAIVLKTPLVPFHGRTTGFIVNYTPDNAVRFDLEGIPVERLNRAYLPGQVRVSVGRRELPSDWGFR